MYRFMEEFSQHAFHVTNFKQARDGWGDAFPKERIDLTLARTDHVNWILTSIPILEGAYSTVLEFSHTLIDRADASGPPVLCSSSVSFLR